MELIEFQYRRLQAGSGGSILMVLPKQCVAGLRLNKGDYVKCFQDGNRIVIEPAEKQG